MNSARWVEVGLMKVSGAWRFASAATLFAASACSSAPVAPEGFTLSVQFQNLRVANIEQLRITLTPLTDMDPDAAFEAIEAESYEEGAITVDDSAGQLVITVSGDYVRAHATAADGTSPRFAIEMWSDDPQMARGPLIRATVVRMGEQIATGTGYLPGWPVELGGTQQVNVPCGAMFTAQCTAMP